MSNYDRTSENIPDEYKEKMKDAYRAGFNAGKEEGYDEGYSEKEDEYDDSDTNSQDDGYKEGYDTGLFAGEMNFTEMIGYDAIRNIQEATGYQICYGATIDRVQKGKNRYGFKIK